MQRLLLVSSWVLTALANGAVAQEAIAQEIDSLLEDSLLRHLHIGYQQRHALVIGIGSYQERGLPERPHAEADARALAKVLDETLGFDRVQLLVNEETTGAAIRQALGTWALDPEQVGDQDLLVVYFSGHSLAPRDPQGNYLQSYLVPVDARTDAEGQPRFESLIPLNRIDATSRSTPARDVLFLLDCAPRGLPDKTWGGFGGHGRYVIAAAEPGLQLLSRGDHSLFGAAVLETLQGVADRDGDGLTIGEFFSHVQLAFVQAGPGLQPPRMANLLDHEGGTVVFYGPPESRDPTALEILERLRSASELARDEHQLQELLLRAPELLLQAADLWPRRPAMIPRYQSWLQTARELLGHEATLKRQSLILRRKTYLSQLIKGQLHEEVRVAGFPGVMIQGPNGDGEPKWDLAPVPERKQFRQLQRSRRLLEQIGTARLDMVERLEVANNIVQRSITDHEQPWDEAITDIAVGDRYNGLEIEPQVGLVPLGPDPESGLWEFWQVETGECPAADGRLQPTDQTGLIFVLVPGGNFVMGAQNHDPHELNYDPLAGPEEGPIHAVTLEPFLLSKFEVTQAQWQRLMGENPSRWNRLHRIGPRAPRHPVEQVSWEDCSEALRRLDLRLPSEAEWEYAARGSSSLPWWTGEKGHTLHGSANLADLRFGMVHPEERFSENWDDEFAYHAPVGSFRANALGFHDTAGNVSEWCLDSFLPGHDETPTDCLDPSAPGGAVTFRTHRGGSFYHGASSARSACRDWARPEARIYDLGVRPARTLQR
jgi:formylglycine-generating enzyme required for sulfatase activity